jgi:phosphoribosylglycinamide formyltransferase 1
MAANGVVLLAGAGDSTAIVANELRRRFGPVTVVLECPVSRWRLLRRRARRLGPTSAFGQALFVLVAMPVLGRLAAARVREIVAGHDLDLATPGEPIIPVPSVNSEDCRRVLTRLNPEVVVVNGTRIIGTPTLRCIEAPFLNMHAGITPQYRGVHGAYWALAEGRPELVGTTVHVIDAGIDTGPILGQATFAVTPADSFASYPFLHTAAGVPMLVDAVAGVLRGEDPLPRPALSSSEPSKLRFHPTFWGYLACRWRRGVR